MSQLILTEGSKARLLQKLTHLVDMVTADVNRDTILWYASAIMPAVVAELNYYTPSKKNGKTTKQGGMG